MNVSIFTFSDNDLSLKNIPELNEIINFNFFSKSSSTNSEIGINEFYNDSNASIVFGNSINQDDTLKISDNQHLLMNNIIFTIEKDSKYNKGKRGRKTEEPKNSKKPREVHGNKGFDNILRKIQVHFLTFMINFCNDALKHELPLFPYFFKQINTDKKECVNHYYVSKLKKESIEYFLKINIAQKYKRYRIDDNEIILNKTKGNSKWLDKIYKMNYLELFKLYYNQGKYLDKIIYDNKEIILSQKTKPFYCLLEKDENKNLESEIIKCVKDVYFSGYNSVTFFINGKSQF